MTLVRAPPHQRRVTHATLNVKIAVSILDMEVKIHALVTWRWRDVWLFQTSRSNSLKQTSTDCCVGTQGGAHNQVAKEVSLGWVES